MVSMLYGISFKERFILSLNFKWEKVLEKRDNFLLPFLLPLLDSFHFS